MNQVYQGRARHRPRCPKSLPLTPARNAYNQGCPSRALQCHLPHAEESLRCWTSQHLPAPGSLGLCWEQGIHKSVRVTVWDLWPR